MYTYIRRWFAARKQRKLQAIVEKERRIFSAGYDWAQTAYAKGISEDCILSQLDGCAPLHFDRGACAFLATLPETTSVT